MTNEETKPEDQVAGKVGSIHCLPDPVRFLEMAEALYIAERDDLCPPQSHKVSPDSGWHFDDGSSIEISGFAGGGHPDGLLATVTIVHTEADGSEEYIDFVRENKAQQVSRDDVLEKAVEIIETYKIPIGNSPAGEMACEWTRDALTEIRDAIRALKSKNVDAAIRKEYGA